MYTAICNIERQTSRSEEHQFTAQRAYRNAIASQGYQSGTAFTYRLQSEVGLWVSDAEGAIVFFPKGEVQCLEEVSA